MTLFALCSYVKLCPVQLLAQVWGCAFDNATDFGRLNLADPYVTDTAMVPAHSWTVIRVHFANPGDELTARVTR